MDFNFDSPDFSKLTDDNKSAKQMELIHLLQASTDADLNLKIASCKKVCTFHVFLMSLFYPYKSSNELEFSRCGMGR